MPRQAGYFDHVRARNELSIFKQAPKPAVNVRTTAPADSTTEPTLGRKRKSDAKKKTAVKGKKKKKKKASSSSSSSEDDDDELDPSLYDLNTPLLSIAKYIKNPEEMVREMFRSVEKTKIRNMLPENIKKIDLEELHNLCVQQLEGMSKKRIRSILSATPMDGSSGSDSSDDSEEEMDEMDEEEEEEEVNEEETEPQPDSTSFGVERDDLVDVSEEEGVEASSKETKAGKGGKKQLEILELEMRARAIRSMLEKKKQKVDAKALQSEEGDLDILKEFDEEESNQEEVPLEEVDTEERKLSVRKLTEMKLKAQQEENAVDSSDGVQESQDPAKSAEKGKSLQLKQAEILKKAAKLRKKKKKDLVDGDVAEGRLDFRVNKAKLNQRSFRKRHSSGRRGDDERDQPYSHTYAAYVAAFGDPRMVEYSDSYGASASASGHGSWQPRELSVEEEVRALMDELIYRVDPYGAEYVYSFFDNSVDQSLGRGETTTEAETFDGDSSLRSRYRNEGYGNLEPRPRSNNSFTDDFDDGTRDNTRDHTRDNSEYSDSSDEDRFLDGDQLSKLELTRAKKINLKFATKRSAQKQTPAGKKLQRRKVREEKAITLEDLGPPTPAKSASAVATMVDAESASLRPQKLPPSSYSHEMLRAPTSSAVVVPKKKKPEEDLEEGELSDEDEEEDGRFNSDVDEEFVAGHEAPFIPREAYYARQRRRREVESPESSGSGSSGSRSPSQGSGGRRRRSYSRSSSEEARSPVRRRPWRNDY